MLQIADYGIIAHLARSYLCHSSLKSVRRMFCLICNPFQNTRANKQIKSPSVGWHNGPQLLKRQELLDEKHTVALMAQSLQNNG